MRIIQLENHENSSFSNEFVTLPFIILKRYDIIIITQAYASLPTDFFKAVQLKSAYVQLNLVC